MISVTSEAQRRISEIKKGNEFLRISIISGGCHGFSYKFSLDSQIQDSDDLLIKNNSESVIVVIKKKFAEKLKDSVLDFKKTISSSYFTLESKEFDTKCGCGTSFSLKS